MEKYLLKKRDDPHTITARAVYYYYFTHYVIDRMNQFIFARTAISPIIYLFIVI